MTLDDLEPVVALRRKDGTGIGDNRIRLLEAIDEKGSISAAARAVGLTYKAAWDAVAAVNNLSETPLVEGRTGGRAGGGAVLTEEGRRFLHRAQFLRDAINRLSRELAPGLGQDQLIPTFSWRVIMKTSARNMLLCKVIEVKRGAVNAEIVMEIAEGIPLIAIVTEESVKALDLKSGASVIALIKSSFVLLAPEGEVGRISARNAIGGTVVRRDDGAVNSEVVLDIGGGKTIAAIITKESAFSLGFKIGDRAVALIKASHIILAVD